MQTNSPDEKTYLRNVSRIASAVERIADALEAANTRSEASRPEVGRKEAVGTPKVSVAHPSRIFLSCRVCGGGWWSDATCECSCPDPNPPEDWREMRMEGVEIRYFPGPDSPGVVDPGVPVVVDRDEAFRRRHPVTPVNVREHLAEVHRARTWMTGGAVSESTLHDHHDREHRIGKWDHSHV